MIGVYNYTVVLTYLSLLSAGSGIVISLAGNGHPYWGMFCLLLCGLFDAFDGIVARTKKDRTDLEKNFGIQIDSLSDLVAFGVLPACIGAAVLFRSPFLKKIIFAEETAVWGLLLRFFLFSILIVYILSALIRLAYYNVTEEERQRTEGGKRKYFVGVPVTSAALVFPMVLLLNYLIRTDLALLYIFICVLYIFAFVCKIHVPKPGKRGIAIMIGIGVVEVVLLILLKYLFHR